VGTAHPTAAIARALLRWFDANARDLPWRGTRDLYSIWISEIMLQQTQVATVIPYWQRFLARFPDVTELARADEHEVLKLWEGLGYYRRARQLHAAARHIAASCAGQFPESYERVRALPGIGRYTAGAILSIGLDQRLPILEANTIRVLSRLSAYRGDVKSTNGQKHLWSLAEALLPKSRCGAFNQALMELGSQICTPRDPRCESCSVAAWCQARANGLVAKIPASSQAKNYEEVTEVAVVIRRGEKVFLRQCQRGERWAGLWDFPRFPLKVDRSVPERSASHNGARSKTNRITTDILHQHITAGTKALTGLAIQPGELLTTLKHGVTRFRITLHCYEARPLTKTLAPRSKQQAGWVAIQSLADYPLSTTGRKITRLLQESKG
jgi:A/G-specific adenine glycosylase